jgi:hypothetical protein
MSIAPLSSEVPGNDERTTPAASQPVLLESDVPLSQSLIWRLQREFYVQRGLKAWTEDMVPQFMTNNPFIAEIYARIVFNFLGDCTRPEVSTANPLRILELGAGVGKFSYLFLRHLTGLLRVKRIPLETVRYCMTDCSESLIQAWRTNSYLAEFVECGVLEFELLQAGHEINSTFLSRKGPLVLIANYVFDSLPQDAFVIKDGQIFEALVTTMSPTRSGESEKEVLSRLQLSYNDASVPSDRYSDQSWNQILELYRSHLSAATVLFPCAAIKALQELGGLTDGRMLVLAADKGFVHEEVLSLCQGPPTLEFHASNCFSQMVNFDAIGKYFLANGGEALAPDKHFASLNICAFVQGRLGDQFPATVRVYREAQAGIGVDDVFMLLGWLNAHMEEMSVPQILAVLRLSRWDPVALLRLFPVLARQLRGVSTERSDLRNAVMKTWANHYPVHPSENVIAFDCGVILLELRFFADAFSMFKASQQILGPTAATSYNLGLCSLGLGRSSEALALMVEACELDPGFEPAKLTRKKLEDENIQN